jgi:hypothetical protein
MWSVRLGKLAAAALAVVRRRFHSRTIPFWEKSFEIDRENSLHRKKSLNDRENPRFWRKQPPHSKSRDAIPM